MKAGHIFLGIAFIGIGFMTGCMESVVEDMMIEKQEIVFSHFNDKATRGEGGGVGQELIVPTMIIRY